MATDDATPTPGPADPGTMPTPLDALGRELVAIRQFAATLVMFCDAALTNFRMCQLAETSRETVRLDNGETIVDKFRRSSGLASGGMPTTFGRRAPAPDIDGADDGPLQVPPIGGGNEIQGT